MSVCQGECTCIYIGFGQGPFPKSGLDKMSVFPMIGLGSFYCSTNCMSIVTLSWQAWLPSGAKYPGFVSNNFLYHTLCV